MYGYDLDKMKEKDYNEEINRLKDRLISDPLAINKINYLSVERDKHIKKRDKNFGKRYKIALLILTIIGIFIAYFIYLQGKWLSVR